MKNDCPTLTIPVTPILITGMVWMLPFSYTRSISRQQLELSGKISFA